MKLRLRDRRGAQPSWSLGLALALNPTWQAYLAAEPAIITDAQKLIPERVRAAFMPDWLHREDAGLDVASHGDPVMVETFDFETGERGAREVLAGDCEDECFKEAAEGHAAGIPWGAYRWILCIAGGRPHCVLAIEAPDKTLIFDGLQRSVLPYGHPAFTNYTWLSASEPGGTWKEIERP